MSVSAVVLLLPALASAFGPPQPSSSPCALIVSGPPPRSSSFDHANGAFGGPREPPYTPETTCITYDAVNAAFEAAKRTVGLRRVTPGQHFGSADVGQLGTVIHETSRNLAKQYGLSRDAVANGLGAILGLVAAAILLAIWLRRGPGSAAR